MTGSPVIRESRSEEKRAGSAARRFIPPSSHGQDVHQTNAWDKRGADPKPLEARLAVRTIAVTASTANRKYRKSEARRGAKVWTDAPRSSGGFSEPVRIGSRDGFQSERCPGSEAIFMTGERNFWGARIAPVTFMVRRLWRTNHAAPTQDYLVETMAYLASYATHRRQVSKDTFFLLFSTSGGRPQGLTPTGCV